MAGLQLILLISCIATSVVHSEVLFQRPQNEDCVAPDAVAAASVGAVQFFPRDFLADGVTIIDTPELVQIDNAIGFDVTYSGNVKIVNNSIAGEVYVLYQCGTPMPNAAAYPVDAKMVQIPLTAVTVPDTTAYAFLAALGVEDRVVNLTSLVTGACGQHLVQCGRVVPSMVETSNSTMLMNTFGATTDALMSTLPTEVPFGVAINAPTDPGPLNRAEWIKYVSLFFNKEPEANAYFDSVRQQYNSIKALQGSGMQSEDGALPVVAWVSYQSTFPPAAYSVSLATYKDILVKDAGGQMLNRSDVLAAGAAPSSFSPLNLQFTWGPNQTFETKGEAQMAVYELLQDVDILIDETYSMTPEKYNLTTFLDGFGFGSVAMPLDDSVSWWNNSAVLRLDGIINPNGGLDWFESSVVNPDKILAQLAMYLQDNMEGDMGNMHEGYFRNIAVGEQPAVIPASACTLFSTCSVTPAIICPFVRPCATGSAAIRTTASDGTCDYTACSN